jgi:hypothetical protein
MATPKKSPLPFIPTLLQRRILAALEYRALRADDLQAELNVDRSWLYRGGLHELMREGLVKNHRRVGYYRPDAPPPEYPELRELSN